MLTARSAWCLVRKKAGLNLAMLEWPCRTACVYDLKGDRSCGPKREFIFIWYRGTLIKWSVPSANRPWIWIPNCKPARFDKNCYYQISVDSWTRCSPSWYAILWAPSREWSWTDMWSVCQLLVSHSLPSSCPSRRTSRSPLRRLLCPSLLR